MTAPQPTLAGFNLFLSNEVKIPSAALPPSSPWPGYAMGQALALTNPALRIVPIPNIDAAGASLNSGGWTIYALAVYNLATDILINITPDQTGFDYFAKVRKENNINGFVSGVVQSSSDEGTSVGIVVQEAAKNFTLSDIQRLKTPWGRNYLMIAQSYGPATWGIS